MTKTICQECGGSFPSWGIVHLGAAENARRLCWPCGNAAIAAQTGLGETNPPQFAPVILRDRRNRRRKFHFRSMLVPTGLAIEAFEIVRNAPGGYYFEVLGGFDADPLDLYRTLYERMRRALEIDHLDHHEDGSIGLRHPGLVRGRIEWDRHADEPHCEPEIVIDGRTFSWRQFGHMLMTFEGWNVRLEIVDKSEEDYIEPLALRRPT